MTLFLHQPRGTLALTFLELLNTMVYFGTMVSLVLFLTHTVKLPSSRAYAVYGVYLATLYTLPLISGYAADRFIGAQNAILYGGILLLVGCLVFGIAGKSHYALAIAAIILGTSFFKSSVPALLGKLYTHQTAAKESGFTLFYAGMNAGAILGPIILGLTASFWSWSIGFIVFSAVLAFMLIFYAFLYRNFSQQDQYSTYATHPSWRGMVHIISVIAIGLMLVFLTFVFRFTYWYHWVAIGIMLLTLLFLIRLLKQEHSTTRKQLGILVFINVVNVVFFAAELQMGGSLALFIKHHVNRQIFGWTLPTEFLTALLPLFVTIGPVLMLPYFRKLKNAPRHQRIFRRLMMSLAFAGLSFIAFALTATYTAAHMNTSWGLLGILIGYALLGFGEINIGPIAYAAVSYLAPVSLQNTFMGIYYLFISFSGYIAGGISRLTVHDALPSQTEAYSPIFLKLCLILWVTACVVALSYPLLKRVLTIKNTM